MTFSKINILIPVLFSLQFISCTREIPQVADLEKEINKSATLQVFNATVKSVRNYIYIDGVPVTGATLGFGSIFPAAAFGIKITPGPRAILIKDTTANTIQVPITFTQNFDAGKSYTTFTYDTLTSIKQITIVNNITIPTDTTSRLRFANFIYNTTALSNVDVYSFRKIPGIPLIVNSSPVLSSSTPVFTNIATNSITEFIPYASGLSDTLYVVATGTTTPIITKQLLTSLVPSRSYTSVYNGSFKGTKGVSTFATY